MATQAPKNNHSWGAKCREGLGYIDFLINPHTWQESATTWAVRMTQFIKKQFNFIVYLELWDPKMSEDILLTHRTVYMGGRWQGAQEMPEKGMGCSGSWEPMFVYGW